MVRRTSLVDYYRPRCLTLSETQFVIGLPVQSQIRRRSTSRPSANVTPLVLPSSSPNNPSATGNRSSGGSRPSAAAWGRAARPSGVLAFSRFLKVSQLLVRTTVLNDVPHRRPCKTYGLRAGRPSSRFPSGRPQARPPGTGSGTSASLRTRPAVVGVPDRSRRRTHDDPGHL